MLFGSASFCHQYIESFECLVLYIRCPQRGAHQRLSWGPASGQGVTGGAFAQQDLRLSVQIFLKCCFCQPMLPQQRGLRYETEGVSCSSHFVAGHFVPVSSALCQNSRGCLQAPQSWGPLFYMLTSSHITHNKVLEFWTVPCEV